MIVEANYLDVSDYKSPRVTTDIAIIAAEDKEVHNERKVPTKGLQVLLIKRDDEPFKDMWTLPGGFVDTGKGLLKSVEDKLRQKTGIQDCFKEQLFTYGDDTLRDPREHIISVAYVALTTKEKLCTTSDGDKETAWFWINTVRDNIGTVIDAEFNRVDKTESVAQLGFDHKNIVKDALNRLSNKILYTDIGFNLVGNEFTIKELQMAYEAVVGRELVGFRRSIEPKIIETGKNTLDVKDKPDLHRPAKLYKKR